MRDGPVESGMSILSVERPEIETALRVTRLAAAEGSIAHPFRTALLDRAARMRDLADAVHFLCMLHGRHPGLADLAENRASAGAIAPTIRQLAAGFAAERPYLTRLVVAVGPLPSTIGQAECEAAVLGQHHALDMLARSDRAGTAIGAGLALALDWPAIRAVLDAAAERCGIAIEPAHVPAPAGIQHAIATAAETVAIGRAIGFGASQLFVQHRGLWDLLQSRAAARPAD